MYQRVFTHVPDVSGGNLLCLDTSGQVSKHIWTPLDTYRHQMCPEVSRGVQKCPGTSGGVLTLDVSETIQVSRHKTCTPEVYTLDVSAGIQRCLDRHQTSKPEIFRDVQRHPKLSRH